MDVGVAAGALRSVCRTRFRNALLHHPAVQWNAPASQSALSTAILVAMWNYMGWDNASTVAQEVEDPQRTYPRAMLYVDNAGRHHVRASARRDRSGWSLRR